MEELVVLVDDADRELGCEEKLAAHRSGALHRAFSTFVTNRSGQLLLQRRAATKYHSPRLWSNTCCGHPRPGESIEAAAHRRLREEMGFDCSLTVSFSFTYRAELGGGMVEHEIDHVLVGQFNGDPVANPEEVEAWRWIDKAELAAEIAAHPHRYTAWLGIALEQLKRRESAPSL
ncbi:MAG: isopentenyl-diphosphate delta-isomerase [Gemmatimonas sp. SG8_17]|nr:MAG: isopentenyl-diphosphate delta-isomerase [Gemmatimonas sp. SG8_17]